MSEVLVKSELTIQGILDLDHPVGSYYISNSSTSPASLFGGSWEQIKDRFLLAASSTYSAGSTGGEATHKLTISEMPTHHHNARGLKSGGTAFEQNKSYIDGWGNTGTSGTIKGYGIAIDYDSGGGNAHNNMPPYIAAYVWRRTA